MTPPSGRSPPPPPERRVPWIALESRPLFHACLNASAALLLTVGYAFIRRRNIAAHASCMLAAVAVSTVFLVSYVDYHLHVGSVRFAGEGWSRPLYFTILLTHTALAPFVVVLVAIVLWRAVRRDFLRHRALARWTLPIWIYVSLTGVLVYLMLYVWFAPS